MIIPSKNVQLVFIGLSTKYRHCVLSEECLLNHWFLSPETATVLSTQMLNIGRSKGTKAMNFSVPETQSTSDCCKGAKCNSHQAVRLCCPGGAQYTEKPRAVVVCETFEKVFHVERTQVLEELLPEMYKHVQTTCELSNMLISCLLIALDWQLDRDAARINKIIRYWPPARVLVQPCTTTAQPLLPPLEESISWHPQTDLWQFYSLSIQNGNWLSCIPCPCSSKLPRINPKCTEICESSHALRCEVGAQLSKKAGHEVSAQATQQMSDKMMATFMEEIFQKCWLPWVAG